MVIVCESDRSHLVRTFFNMDGRLSGFHIFFAEGIEESPSGWDGTTAWYNSNRNAELYKNKFYLLLFVFIDIFIEGGIGFKIKGLVGMALAKFKFVLLSWIFPVIFYIQVKVHETSSKDSLQGNLTLNLISLSWTWSLTMCRSVITFQ